jgi:hypothetical protein
VGKRYAYLKRKRSNFLTHHNFLRMLKVAKVKVARLAFRKARYDLVSQCREPEIVLATHDARSKNEPAGLTAYWTSSQLTKAFVAGLINVCYVFFHKQLRVEYEVADEKATEESN